LPQSPSNALTKRKTPGSPILFRGHAQGYEQFFPDEISCTIALSNCRDRRNDRRAIKVLSQNLHLADLVPMKQERSRSASPGGVRQAPRPSAFAITAFGPKRQLENVCYSAAVSG
jgi:hypothetical protein